MGAHSLKAGALINPSYIKSSRFFFLLVPGSSYFLPLKKKIINKVVRLQKYSSDLAWQKKHHSMVESIWVLFFFFLSTHFEIRCILSSSLEMLIFFPSHFKVTLCVAEQISPGTIALQKD